MKFGAPIGGAGAWQKFQASLRKSQPGAAPSQTRLREVSDFGTNPGNLRMFNYVSPSAPESPALVVVLHGCGQSAAGYDHGAGWSTLADRYGFALLMPEQQRSNNQNGCFNWFQPEDTQRNRGEAASIAQMVDTMVRNNDIDTSRVFITGLSAGGAMTSVMLACYPDLFAAGAIIAGLPYGSASTLQQALQSMFQCPTRPARDWGDVVREASPGIKVKWPRVSVWHGGADKTVVPANAREVLKQWSDLHGVGMNASRVSTIDGYPRQVWVNDAGEEIIEFYIIPQMAHGTPLATGSSDGQCGASGPFLLEVGISSSFHIATFFGLTRDGVKFHPSVSNAPSVQSEALQRPPPTFLGANLSPDEASRSQNYPASKPVFGIDIGTAITNALTAAGLMK